MKLKPLPALLSALAGLSLPLFASQIKTDEQIQFVRGYARIDEHGEVTATLSAWVYEHERRPGAKTLFAKLADIPLDSATSAERANFEVRSQLFRFDSERGKRVRIRLPTHQEIDLPATDSDGLSQAEYDLGKLSEIALANEDPSEHRSAAQLIRFTAILPDNDPRQFSGQLLLVPASGLSIVSDIDDTIKDSNVLNRTELIKNTFLRDFKSVAGMSALYQRYASHNDNLRFHYLSSSPHQLYPALDTFLQQHQFPIGSVHLRHIDVSEELFGDGASSQRHKLNNLRLLLEQFPLRRFLLIGDSGESDPEIYAEIARQYPEQVAGIFIRDVTGEATEAARYQQTFAGIPATLWRIFTEPASLPTLP